MGLRTYRRARRQGEPQSSFLKLFLAATYHCPEWPFWGAKKAPEQAGCVGPYVALCGHRGGGQGVPRGFGLTGNSLEVVAENTKVGSDLGEPPPGSQLQQKISAAEPPRGPSAGVLDCLSTTAAAGTTRRPQRPTSTTHCGPQPGE